MRLWKKTLLGFGVVFAIIQAIRPARNSSGQATADITKTVIVPDTVMGILKSSCYDCHSNNTRYPWYVNIEPVGWLLASHVKEGKENLNFDEFGSYSNRKGANKLRAIATTIKEGSMPIASYTIMHSDAKLNNGQKALLIDWATKTRDSLLTKR